MIYNLLAYLESALPNVDFTVNGFTNEKEANDEVAINEMGGGFEQQFKRSDPVVQVMIRNSDSVQSRGIIYSVHKEVTRRVRQTLPAKTVGGVFNPEIIAWRMTPTNDPSFIGRNTVGQYLWVFNLIITLA